MRQGFCRVLLVLALLLSLSRASFGDTFPVSGVLEDSGDIMEGSITLPSCTIVGGSPAEWGEFGTLWTIGSVAAGEIDVELRSFGGWSFDGFTGSQSFGQFLVVTGPFTVEDDSPAGVPSTWTGELDLSDDFGTTLFEIQMAGAGTASFSGRPGPESDEFYLIYGTADVTGVGQVVYEAPSVPEPSTLTLLGIGIATILCIRFRRRQKAIASCLH